MAGGLGSRHQEFLLEVAKGNVADHSVMVAMGERTNMGTTATGEDIWRGNELTPAPTSHLLIPTPSGGGEQFTVVSESVNDTSAGSGAQTIRLEIVRLSDGGIYFEDIVMNGTTGVNTIITDGIFVNDMYSLTVGATGVAEGHIKIYKTGTVGLVYNMIAAGGNKSLVPHRMIPAGYNLILRGWHGEEVNTKNCTLRIRSTDMNGVLISGVFCFKGCCYVTQNTTGELELYTHIPALSIVKVSGWASQATAIASCGWHGVLYKL